MAGGRSRKQTTSAPASAAAKKKTVKAKVKAQEPATPRAQKAATESEAPAATKKTPAKTAGRKAPKAAKVGARQARSVLQEASPSEEPTVRGVHDGREEPDKTPAERPLTDEEREAMHKVAESARRYIGASGDPMSIVQKIATFIEEVRLGDREEPKSQDIRLGLGVLWGEQLRAQIGWRWVHLTYPDGFASYALVPDDRAFSCFPLNRVPDALRANASNTTALVFASIRDSHLPSRSPSSYTVIG